MDDFDTTLTPEERAAPTFLEWSDATLARGVRDIARRLLDEMGTKGIIGAGAALALEKIARESNAARLDITLDGTRVTVRMPNTTEHRT